jgi:hypothetical protein
MIYVVCQICAFHLCSGENSLFRSIFSNIITQCSFISYFLKSLQVSICYSIHVTRHKMISKYVISHICAHTYVIELINAQYNNNAHRVWMY